MSRFSSLDISRLSLVNIATLWTLAISHPLYDLLTRGDHATFFVAHQSKSIDVYIFVLTLSVLLPLLVFSLLFLLNLASSALARTLYAAALAAFFTLLSLLVFESLQIEFGGLSLVIPLAVGLLTTYLFISLPWAQTALSFMSIAVILSPLIFLCDSSIRTFLSSREAQDYSLISNEKELPNIVMVVFDELPLTSLLDEARLIDDGRFPNFSRLAKSAYWFRNTSTTHYSTRGGALPSILTGWYPGTYLKNALKEQTDTNAPIVKENMPNNIFTLLERTHKIFAVETMSNLAPENQLIEQKAPRVRERLSSLSCDALVVYSHLVVPQHFKSRIPNIHGQWRDFCTLNNDQLPTSIEWPFASGGQPEYVKRFIESFDKKNNPAFYFLHSVLPHFPFKYDANGEVHENKLNVMSGVFRWVTGKNHWRNETIANLAYQAHLIQLMFTDQLLGRVLDRLNTLDLFEKSLIIVTADHGTTFYWDSEGRESDELKKIQASDTMYVPLFIKMPNQTQGVISERQVETIDVVPTIASVLDLNIPWQPDGMSVFADNAPNHDRSAMIPGSEEFGTIIDPKYSSLKRKIELFGTGNLNDLYLIGPHPEIVGRAVSSFLAVPSQERVQLLPPKYPPGPPNTNRVQAYVEGTLSNQGEKFDIENSKIAIALNGKIVNTTRSTSVPISELGKGVRINGHREMEEDGNVHFLVRIPLSSWSEDVNNISVHIITENNKGSPVSLINFSTDP